jgi:hypothetical protein
MAIDSTGTWSSIWGALTALGTICVCILAIWGDWFRAFFAGPKLKLVPYNLRGELTYLNPGNIPVIYYHLKVENERSWAPARNVRVLLVGLLRRLPNGEFKRKDPILSYSSAGHQVRHTNSPPR